MWLSPLDLGPNFIPGDQLQYKPTVKPAGITTEVSQMIELVD